MYWRYKDGLFPYTQTTQDESGYHISDLSEPHPLSLIATFPLESWANQDQAPSDIADIRILALDLHSTICFANTPTCAIAEDKEGAFHKLELFRSRVEPSPRVEYVWAMKDGWIVVQREYRDRSYDLGERVKLAVYELRQKGLHLKVHERTGNIPPGANRLHCTLFHLSGYTSPAAHLSQGSRDRPHG
jgi:hypothetical protein